MYPAQQNATDQTANFFWVLCIVIGAFLVAWWFHREWFVVPIYWLRLRELYALQVTATVWNQIAGLLHLPSMNMTALNQAQHYLTIADPQKESFAGFVSTNSFFGQWMRYPVILILLTLSLFMYFKHGNIRYSHVYNMNELKKAENKNWAQITPVLSIDLLKIDLDEGPWAMANTPLHWCTENGVLHPIEIDNRKVWNIDKAPVERLFVLQMGPLWRGAEALPIHIQLLMVVFIGRATRERDIAHRLLAQVARSAGGGQLNFSGVAEYVQKYKNTKILRFLEKKHAYVYTLMAELLVLARADGVLASAEFLWLKPVDRRLWLMLNCVGRQTAFIEISGPFSHWLAERKIGRALRTPMVKEAVVALENNMKDTLRVEKEDRWHTYSGD